MENFTKDKITTADRFFALLEKRFATAISAFIFGGVVVIIFLHFFVIPDKNKVIESKNEVIESKNKIIEDKEERIKALEQDVEIWKSLYFDSPNNMKKIYELFDNIKEDKLETLSEQSNISDELEKTQRVIDKNNKEISKLKKELK